MKQQLTDPFQAVSDPNGRQMLHLLSRESLTINALAENFDMTGPAVSKHIKIRYGAGFISAEDIGRERHCMLNPYGFSQLQKWIDYFDKFWQTKLSRLETLSNEKIKK